MNISVQLQSAVDDYKMLLGKGYPPASTFHLVANRYRLNSSHRSVLYRGIHDRDISNKRLSRLTIPENIRNNAVYIDALNQIITVAAYLTGKTVFISTDGLLRDAMEIHGNTIPENITFRSCNLIFMYLDVANPSAAWFVIDDQPDLFDSIHETLKSLCSGHSNHGVVTRQNADTFITSLNEGIVCTSDSQIIDRIQLPVFDLAAHTLSFHFNPDFIRLIY